MSPGSDEVFIKRLISKKKKRKKKKETRKERKKDVIPFISYV